DPNFDIRIAFEYGITDRFMLGVSRSKKDENLEGLAKYRLLRQTVSGSMPVSVSVFGSIVYTPKEDNPEQPLFANSELDRFTHTGQVIIARKFSSKFSLEVVGSIVHRNVITDTLDNNDVYSVGAGGRLKITRSFSLIADCFN